MAVIVPDLLLDVPEFQKNWPEFKAIDNCAREKIVPDMEVKLRRIGEHFRVKIEEVNGEILIGKVLTKEFYFTQLFQEGDLIQFEKKNVIDICDINRWGVLY